MLNIDELLGESKKIVFVGTEYIVNDPTLETILLIDKMIGEAKGETEQLEVMGKAINMMIPGFDITKVPVRAYASIFNYLIGNDEKNAPAEAKEAETPT